MYRKKIIVEDTFYIGGSDRRIALFENVYPLENGVSYNSYIIMDEKTCVIDGVDESIVDLYLDQMDEILSDRPLDYLIVEHMEPDHAFALKRVIEKHPNVNVVFNSKSFEMFKNFNANFEVKNVTLVKEGDVLSLGKHQLTFVFAPMVHRPEVMLVYDLTTKTLFSADAFGTFGALAGNIFTDKEDFKEKYLDEARRYYTNIVGKYGPQVMNVLKKASTIEIQNICPLHGPIWKKDLNYILGLYTKWATYEPEVEGALIVYGTVYGHGQTAATIFAEELAEKGVKSIAMYDVSKTDKSYLVGEAFKYSHLIIVSSTYNMGIFTPMEEFLLDLKYHNLQNRKYVVIENGSWAPNSGKLILEIMAQLKGFEQIGEKVTFRSSVKEDDALKIYEIADKVSEEIVKPSKPGNPLFNLTYGLFVLSTFDGKKQNGCIINTATQVANSPDKIMIAINKNNYSCKTLLETGVANLSIITESAAFSLFQRFGFQSGATVDKFEGFKDYEIAKNGVNFIKKSTNSVISLKVIETSDLGSHIGFLCEITETVLLNDEPSVSYTFYMKNIKPAPAKQDKKKVGWVCKICGYFYEGEVLPPDFICPLCKHGAADFEKVG